MKVQREENWDGLCLRSVLLWLPLFPLDLLSKFSCGKTGLRINHVYANILRGEVCDWYWQQAKCAAGAGSSLAGVSLLPQPSRLGVLPPRLPCPFPAQAGEAGSGELGIFVDNVALRTNVYRDCFSAAEGRGRTGQARAQTRDWFWSWMVEGRKEYTAPSIFATYLFNPIVISISLDVWKHPQWIL